MRAQIEHLVELCRLRHVTVQVAPFARSGPAAPGPFTILRFAEPTLPDIVYLEQLTSATYLDKRDDIDRYLTVMNRLCMEAFPADDTEAFLTTMIS